MSYKKKIEIAILILTIPVLLLAREKKRISAIEFKGDFSISSVALKKNFSLKKGQPANREQISSSIKKLQKHLIENGYLYARLDSVVLRTTPKDSAAIRLLIFGSSGPQVCIDKIHIACDSLERQEYLRALEIKEGDPYSENRMQSQINALLTYAAEKGFLFAVAQVDNPFLKKKGGKIFAELKLHISEGPRVYIKNLLLQGNKNTKDDVILREIELAKGDLYELRKVESIRPRLTRLGIFKSVSQPQILKADRDSVYLLITVEEGSATRFDGVVGYIPPSTASKRKGYFSGLLDLNFANLLGTARRFSLHWKKADRYSEEFLLAYTEPWVLNYPLDAGVGLERQVRDTSYIEWKNHINLRLRLFNHLALLANATRTSVNPDSLASRKLRLARNEIYSGEIGIEYDTRDYYINPSSGIYYKSSYSFGIKKVYGPSYLFAEDSLQKHDALQKINLEIAGYYNLWLNQVLAVEVYLRQAKGKHLQLSDYFWLGGSRSLRGYRENQFSGNIVAWSNLEYRFILGRNSRLFLFNDWGYYQSPQSAGSKEKILTGYGLGFRFQTPLGVLGVDYGLGKGDSFSQGKIHFGLINMF